MRKREKEGGIENEDKIGNNVTHFPNLRSFIIFFFGGGGRKFPHPRLELDWKMVPGNSVKVAKLKLVI